MAALTLASGLAAAQAPPTLYLMSGFVDYQGTNNARSEQKLRLFVSENGAAWRELAPGALYEDPHADAGGNVRDPSVAYYRHAWWMAYTNDQVAGATMPRWSIATSSDLLTWTHVADISTADLKGAVHVWAPEFFIDHQGALHVFLAISSDLEARHFQIHETHPIDAADLTGWTTPTPVTGPGLPPDAIDPFVVEQGGLYYLFWKDDAALNLGVSASADLTSGYQLVDGAITAPGANCEGPSVIRVAGDVWRLICDQRVDQGLRVADGADGFTRWTALSPLLNDTGRPWNHGTALRVTDPEAVRTVLAARAAASEK